MADPYLPLVTLDQLTKTDSLSDFIYIAEQNLDKVGMIVKGLGSGNVL